MKDEKKVYKIAQKIDNYNQEEDGCWWSHVLELVENAYLLGRNSLQVIYDLGKNGVTSTSMTKNTTGSNGGTNGK